VIALSPCDGGPCHALLRWPNHSHRTFLGRHCVENLAVGLVREMVVDLRGNGVVVGKHQRVGEVIQPDGYLLAAIIFMPHGKNCLQDVDEAADLDPLCLERLVN
jgi:hypothetical protein